MVKILIEYPEIVDHTARMPFQCLGGAVHEVVGDHGLPVPEHFVGTDTVAGFIPVAEYPVVQMIETQQTEKQKAAGKAKPGQKLLQPVTWILCRGEG